MNRNQIIEQIKRKKSFLCIGLDTDVSKLPKHLLKEEDPAFEFNRQIIDATKEFCVCYKPNTAFYESNGIKGWQALQRTIDYLKTVKPSVFTIADAKRGDIGNTSSMYAKAFFKEMNFDAVTVAPYMGEDSVKPFLEFEGKWAIVLALTSNQGADNFQKLLIQNRSNQLFQEVLKTSKDWGTHANMMFVVGATQGESFKKVREIVPNHFLLVPGVGAQGGSLNDVVKFGMNNDCGLLVNSSRQILYASQDEHFAEKAFEEAKKLQREIAQYL
jgi:orotidine-5'-phosphate decarboxylase